MITDALLAEVLARVAKKHPPRRPHVPVAPPRAVDVDGRCPVELERLLSPVGDDVDNHRNLTCRFYERCLEEAASWTSFSCKMCEHHGTKPSGQELVTIASRRGAGNVP